MARKTLYIWVLSLPALLWPALAVAVGQDLTDDSPAATSNLGDNLSKSDEKQPLPPDQKASNAPAEPAKSADATGGCNGLCASANDCEDCCKLTCPDQTVKRLFGDCCWLKCHDITVQGWAEAGYAWRDGSRNPDGFNGPDGFNDRDEEFQLNQFYTTIQKALKDNDCCWDWGFTVDLLYGSDYRYPLSKGLDARDDGTPKWHTDDRRLYGLALPQAYLEFGTKALSYKAGHFYTLLGNEVVPAIGNVFYSHTYTFLYAYPFTHTGFLATYKPSDQLTIVNGINEGWDNFDDTDENVGYTGEAIFTAKDKHTTLTYAWQFSNEPIVSGGNPTANPNARHGRFIESTVLAHDWNDRTSYVIESCFGSQSAGEAEGDTATWYGIDSYVTYKLNCCWTARAASSGSATPTAPAWRRWAISPPRRTTMSPRRAVSPAASTTSRTA